jgi:hypothetical protein
MDFNYKWFVLGIGISWAILWCAFGFLTFVIQRRYIVKRYEVETNLAETEKFLLEVYRPWIKMFPVLKAVCYSTHLLIIMCRSDKTMKKNPYFKDSPSRAEILSHFSKKECVLTAVTLGCGFLGVALLAIYSLLDWLWK